MTWSDLDDRDSQPDYHQPLEHDPRCRNGWIGGRNTDHPTPCYTCKPWLANRRDTPQPRSST